MAGLWPLRRAALSLAIACLALGAGRMAVAMDLLHSERSLYRQVLVYEDAGKRYLCFTRNCTIGRQSVLDLGDRNRLVFDYTKMMMSALFLQPAPRRVLVIGLGGGTLPRALSRLLPQADIDVVEIDPAVTRVAREWFGFSAGGHIAVYEEDGRIFVRRAGRTAGHGYDLIMLDAYDHEYIPEHLLTAEFLGEVRNLLNEGGVVAANTFSSSRLYDSESVTYQKVFGAFYNLKANNRIILARRGPLPDLATIRANGERLAASLAPLGVDTAELLSRFSTQPDWNPSARVLTDQYSPANLLNGAR